jgi:hypothetical protein
MVVSGRFGNCLEGEGDTTTSGLFGGTFQVHSCKETEHLRYQCTGKNLKESTCLGFIG